MQRVDLARAAASKRRLARALGFAAKCRRRSRLASACLALACLASAALAQGRQIDGFGGAPNRAGARCGPRPISLPGFELEVPLGNLASCNASNAQPFGAAFTPDGSRLYVPLFGGFIGSGGCTVARIDAATLQVVDTVVTGEGPEEVAFVTNPDGSLRYGFVSCSAESCVTVFDASDQVVATIPVPWAAGASFPTAFPFGLATAPDQRTVWVGTLDGQGFVHALDVATLALDPARRIELGPRHGVGRMAFCEDRLVLPVTESQPGWNGSTAKLCVVDPAAPWTVDELVLASTSSPLRLPSPQDVAVDCDGRAWIAGFDLGARVIAVDPLAPGGPVVVRQLRTGTSQPDGKFQALGLSPDGLLVACDLWTNELAWLDVRRDEWLATTSASDLPGYFRAPQEIAFDPSGARVVIPWAASDNLSVLEF